jgi:hypothetical protein
MKVFDTLNGEPRDYSHIFIMEHVTLELQGAQSLLDESIMTFRARPWYHFAARSLLTQPVVA